MTARFISLSSSSLLIRSLDLFFLSSFLIQTYRFGYTRHAYTNQIINPDLALGRRIHSVFVSRSNHSLTRFLQSFSERHPTSQLHKTPTEYILESRNDGVSRSPVVKVRLAIEAAQGNLSLVGRRRFSFYTSGCQGQRRRGSHDDHRR